MPAPPSPPDEPAPPLPSAAEAELRPQLEHRLEEAQRRLALLEDELERAVRARDETLSTVSHDLKNPMSAILLGVQRLARLSDEARRPQAVALSEKLERTLRSMSRLVEGLVDLARLDAGRLRLDRRPEALPALVSRVLEPLAGLAAEKGQRLELLPAPELPAVPCDADRIGQVIANLAGNALRFAPGGSTIRVTVERQGHELVCSVSDEGPGIAPELLAHLFERRSSPPGGPRRSHGLGLLLVRGYVEAHGGRVWARSEVGRGSTFSFALPLG